MEARDDGVFQHDQADVTMVSYVLKATRRGKEIIRMLCDNTDVFASACSVTTLMCLLFWSTGFVELKYSVRSRWNAGMGQCWIPMPLAISLV